MVRVLLILFLFTGAAFAGPWPRSEGETFLSFSLDLDAQELDNNFVSLYLEYGLSRDRTVVLDIQGQDDDMSKAFFVLRFPLGETDNALKLSYEFGLGTVDSDIALRTGLSIGRGWNAFDRTGWWSIESRALLFDDGSTNKLEGDATFGLKLTPRIKTITQLQTGAPSDSDFYAKIAQSLVLKASDTHHYLFGITSGIHEADDFQVNIGLWHEF